MRREECAEFAARRQFKFVSMLSVADESVVSMALRMQGVLFVDAFGPSIHRTALPRTAFGPLLCRKSPCSTIRVWDACGPESDTSLAFEHILVFYMKGSDPIR